LSNPELTMYAQTLIFATGIYYIATNVLCQEVYAGFFTHLSLSSVHRLFLM